MSTHISVQEQDFEVAKEYNQLRDDGLAGAIVTFAGLVRDFSLNNTSLYLDHYPIMTVSVLTRLADEAKQRWSLNKVRIIHRVGHLAPGEQIVFIGVSAEHRKAAFEACEFLIDALKTQAPFWKKEGSHWVEAKASDATRAERWLSAVNNEH